MWHGTRLGRARGHACICGSRPGEAQGRMLGPVQGAALSAKSVGCLTMRSICNRHGDRSGSVQQNKTIPCSSEIMPHHNKYAHLYSNKRKEPDNPCLQKLLRQHFVLFGQGVLCPRTLCCAHHAIPEPNDARGCWLLSWRFAASLTQSVSPADTRIVFRCSCYVIQPFYLYLTFLSLVELPVIMLPMPVERRSLVPRAVQISSKSMDFGSNFLLAWEK